MLLNRVFLGIALVLLCTDVLTQTLVKGTIKSATTGETLIGASVTYAPGKGITTDLDGNFTLSIPNGEYDITVSYVGFIPKIQKIKAVGKLILLNFSLENTELQVVEVVADVARTRETPIAFTNISGVKIQEEGANRDLPMMLNSTPGVYATEQGGGMGDSRVNIRGFDQRNVAVMVDGVPVNDMENGQVYWSNWDNLGDVTRTMQVQRGLGASKLAIPSVGGTINIITKGIDGKKGGYIKQEIGNVGMTKSLFGFNEGLSNISLIQQSKTSFGYNSGRLKGGWGITVAGSYRRGQGYVQKTDYEAWGYFIKIQKEFKKQLLTFSVSGAPQVHGQRSTKLPLAVLNTDMANKYNINVDSLLNNSPYSSETSSSSANYSNSAIGDRTARYNSSWGYYYDKDSVKHILNPSQNYYHKPQFNLSHFWSPNTKLTWSNVAYLSIGSGGGESFVKSSSFMRDSATGVFDFTPTYTSNSSKVDKLYDTLLTKSNNIIRASVNDHFWYGLVSTLNYSPSKTLNFMGGIDARSYKGTHYQEVRNLFGGDYYVDDNDKLAPHPTKVGDPNFKNRMKKVGDKFNYNNSGIIRWIGAFTQGELKKGRFTVFANTSFSYTGYKRIDYFRNKDLVIKYSGIDSALTNDKKNKVIHGTVKGDNIIFSESVGYVDTLKYNGQTYTMNSKEARNNQSDWKWFPGYTVKLGSNFNIDERNNVFINAGLLSIAPRYAQFYSNNSNQAYPDVKQQLIKAVEVGYGLKLKRHALNFNIYYTYWTNKPPSSFPTITYNGDPYTYVLQGINTQSAGIEIDATGYITKRLQYDVMTSVADWRYKGSGLAYLYNQGTEELDTVIKPITNNIHTGDAAQIQWSLSLRYEPFKGGYIKLKFNYFGNNYATFDPLTLRKDFYKDGTIAFDNEGRESWKMPDYYYMELHAGYTWNVWKLLFTLNGSIINLLDNNYISDALNGANFDAATAQVYMAQGRRFNLGLKISF